ncbi:MAG: flavodoxin [Pleomorphochaeta sp.]
MNNKLKKIVLAIILINIISPIFAQSKSNILIAYFTWAENTKIINRAKAIKDETNHIFSMEGDSVDSTSSASVIPPGNVTKIAKIIQNKTGGDLFSIQVVDKYSCYWDECLNRASVEKARKARPELINEVPNMSDYDIVFLGFPTWWYTIPMAVATFVEENDLSNKTVIPFVTHGTSGVARTIKDLKPLLPKSANIEKEIGIYRSQINQAQSKVDTWLLDLGF